MEKQNVYYKFVNINQRRAFTRALLKAKTMCIMIAWVTKNKKVNKNPTNVSEESSET